MQVKIDLQFCDSICGMKSYEARLMFLQLTQHRHGVPISEQPGQEAPEIDEAEAFVLAQRAEIDRRALQPA